MPIDFPDSPALNEEFTASGKTWKWNGFAWDSMTITPIGATGPQGTVGATGPQGATGQQGATGPSVNTSLFVQKSGDTMTGQLTLPASTTSSASFNIGVGVNPTNPQTGDLWANSNTLLYRHDGLTRFVAMANQLNLFSRNQVIDVNDAAPALRITQRSDGEGSEALRVEDSTSPDSTAFVISKSGRVGVGVEPDSTVGLKLDSTGVKFNDGTTQTTAFQSTIPSLTITGEAGFGIPVETKATPAISSGTLTLNLSAATFFYVNLNAITSVVFSNPPASPKVFSFTLQFVANGSAYAVTWPASVRWASGVPPTITTTNNKIDTFSFVTHDGGVNWFGFISGQNF